MKARQAAASVVYVCVLLYVSWQAGLILLAVVPPLLYVGKRFATQIGDDTEPDITLAAAAARV